MTGKLQGISELSEFLSRQNLSNNGDGREVLVDAIDTFCTEILPNLSIIEQVIFGVRIRRSKTLLQNPNAEKRDEVIAAISDEVNDIMTVQRFIDDRDSPAPVLYIKPREIPVQNARFTFLRGYDLAYGVVSQGAELCVRQGEFLRSAVLPVDNLYVSKLASVAQIAVEKFTIIDQPTYKEYAKGLIPLVDGTARTYVVAGAVDRLLNFDARHVLVGQQAVLEAARQLAIMKTPILDRGFLQKVIFSEFQTVK